mgnify:CR=1 FL=1
MKKLLSVFLCLVMAFTLVALPVGAAETEKREKNPIIFIAGSSVDICDAEGNIISTGFEVLTDDDEGEEGGISTDAIIESAMNILKPFLLEGLPFDKWDNYAVALYEELAPIWDETQIGGDGNAKYGTGVSAAEIAKWDKKIATVDEGKDGKFKARDYDFRYDWRLSPYDTAEKLDSYIADVMRVTGSDEVNLVGLVHIAHLDGLIAHIGIFYLKQSADFLQLFVQFQINRSSHSKIVPAVRKYMRSRESVQLRIILQIIPDVNKLQLFSFKKEFRDCP